MDQSATNEKQALRSALMGMMNAIVDVQMNVARMRSVLIPLAYGKTDESRKALDEAIHQDEEITSLKEALKRLEKWFDIDDE